MKLWAIERKYAFSVHNVGLLLITGLSLLYRICPSPWQHVLFTFKKWGQSGRWAPLCLDVHRGRNITLMEILIRDFSQPFIFCPTTGGEKEKKNKRKSNTKEWSLKTEQRPERVLANADYDFWTVILTARWNESTSWYFLSFVNMPFWCNLGTLDRVPYI